MLSKQKNDVLTMVGPGTPMGKLLRAYWLPLLYTHELAEPDGPPLRIRLLGESLVAFRDTAGRVGLLDHQCPHRLASLFYGRNEDNGLRCVYHGWQFDVEGRCIDIPNEPGDCPLLSRVKVPAYPCCEANGIIWTYMGAGALPPLPAMGWAKVPVEQKTTLKYIRHCNWVQAMEGDFDSSHLGFLHASSRLPASRDELRPLVARDKQPRLEVEHTRIGMMYAATRDDASGGQYCRITQFHLPFYTSVPAYDGLNRLKVWVPMDDTHTAVWEANWSRATALSHEERQGRRGRVGPSGMLPDTGDWYGRGRFAANAANDYLLDRDRQKHESFSGIEESPPVQDAAMQESMGPIVDRTREHLSASDAAIIRMRQCLVRAAEAHETQGVLPSGVQNPDLYRSHGAQILLTQTGSWKDSYERLMDEQYQGF
jgi:phenylpropionate dioxygenase-like ring-hydroxylating dioxygenase large terminal subunit